MNRMLTLAFVGLSSTRIVRAQPGQAPHAAEHRMFVMDKFTFESGATVPNVKVVYGTYGHLNAARDNVVLLPSHYMATHHGYEWLIGPGLALRQQGDGAEQRREGEQDPGGPGT